MEATEFDVVEQDTKMKLAGDHPEVTVVDEALRISSDDASHHDGNMVSICHPPKLSMPPCSSYLQTGFCTFATDCKFNQSTVEGALGSGNIASSESVGQIECKFYLLPGGCKTGDGCRFLHNLQLNFLGLPIRPGEKKCPFYMRTGGCKFASGCRYHHPEPTAVVDEDSFQDPKQHHGHVEQLCETPWPLVNASTEQAALLGTASYYAPGALQPNLELKPNEQWNGNQAVAIPLHLQEMNINDPKRTLANKDTGYDFSGAVESQQFEEYPQRPSEPECKHFLKTGYCKFKSACRFHHPKSNFSFLGPLQRPTRNNYLHHGLVEQLHEAPILSESTSNEKACFLGPSPSCVPRPFTPKQGLQQNMPWSGNKNAATPSHLQEMSINDQRKTSANKDTAFDFSSSESQQFEEYPQRPGEPECKHFLKTGYCKFKSACRYHHPKSDFNFLSPLVRPISNNYESRVPVEQLQDAPLLSENSSNEPAGLLDPSSSCVPGPFSHTLGPETNLDWNEKKIALSPLHLNEQGQEPAYKNASYEFSGSEPQQIYEYPQRPGEPECQYFLKTGYCKFKSACRYNHPKSNLCFLDFLLRPVRNINDQNGGVEHLSEASLPSESISNEQTTFLGPSSSNVSGQGLEPNVRWNGDEIALSPLHPPELRLKEQGQGLVYKNVSYEFSDGEPQQLFEYPQRPGEPECQYFLKTGYCKFKSACRYNHPKSNLSFMDFLLRPVRNINKQDGPVEHLSEASLPSESTSNEQTSLLGPSSSNVSGQGLGLNLQWNGDEMATRPLHPRELKLNEQWKESANKDTANGFSGGVKSQQFDEYPQRPGEPQCQYFMQTGYCKFKTTCLFHHPKSNISSLGPIPRIDKPICTYYSHHGVCTFGSACRYSHHMENSS